jgi:light-regulated signal transduction histidine kinase (bacteriophytochrome)
MAAIQPCALLLLVGPDWRVEGASANVGMIGEQRPNDLIGQQLADLIGGQAVHALRNRIAWLANGESDVFDFGVQWGDVLLDIRASGTGDSYLIEAELAVEARLPDAIGMVRSMSDRLAGDKPKALAEQAMRQLCTLTGFDRFMLCDRQGEIIAEDGRGKLGATQYQPGSPTGVQLIADCDAEPVPLLGELSADSLGRAAYLAPGDEERERLAASKIASSMTAPLRIDGERVAMLHAHHGTPRRCGAERRGVAHLFAERLVARMARQGWQP